MGEGQKRRKFSVFPTNEKAFPLFTKFIAIGPSTSNLENPRAWFDCILWKDGRAFWCFPCALELHQIQLVITRTSPCVWLAQKVRSPPAKADLVSAPHKNRPLLHLPVRADLDIHLAVWLRLCWKSSCVLDQLFSSRPCAPSTSKTRLSACFLIAPLGPRVATRWNLPWPTSRCRTVRLSMIMVKHFFFQFFVGLGRHKWHVNVGHASKICKPSCGLGLYRVPFGRDEPHTLACTDSWLPTDKLVAHHYHHWEYGH